MWVARTHSEAWTAAIRCDGKFTASGHYDVARCLFEWGWPLIRSAVSDLCREQAAVATMDGDDKYAEKWLNRCKAIGVIE